jgi:hypothetical protein
MRIFLRADLEDGWYSNIFILIREQLADIAEDLNILNNYSAVIINFVI